MFTMVVKKLAVKSDTYVRINGTLYGEAPQEGDVIFVMNKYDKICKARVQESIVREEVAGINVYKKNTILGLEMDVSQIGEYDVVTDTMQNIDSSRGPLINTRLLGLNRAYIEDPDNKTILYLLMKDLVEDAFIISTAMNPDNLMSPVVLKDSYGNKLVLINTNEEYIDPSFLPETAVVMYTQYSHYLKLQFMDGIFDGIVLDLNDPERLPNQKSQIYLKSTFFEAENLLNS